MSDDTITYERWHNYIWAMTQLHMIDDTITYERWHNYIWSMTQLHMSDDKITYVDILCYTKLYTCSSFYFPATKYKYYTVPVFCGVGFAQSFVFCVLKET